MPGTAAHFSIFPFAGLRPESSESRHRGHGCEMAFCPHILDNLRPQNGKMEKSGREKRAWQDSLSFQTASCQCPRWWRLRAGPSGGGPYARPPAQSLTASCAQHLLKNWLSALSPLWTGSLPFHCVVVILTLRNEYWLHACFSNWITGGQSEDPHCLPSSSRPGSHLNSLKEKLFAWAFRDNRELSQAATVIY